jgi:hypothetical protein
MFPSRDQYWQLSQASRQAGAPTLRQLVDLARRRRCRRRRNSSDDESAFGLVHSNFKHNTNLGDGSHRERIRIRARGSRGRRLRGRRHGQDEGEQDSQTRWRLIITTAGNNNGDQSKGPYVVVASNSIRRQSGPSVRSPGQLLLLLLLLLLLPAQRCQRRSASAIQIDRINKQPAARNRHRCPLPGQPANSQPSWCCPSERSCPSLVLPTTGAWLLPPPPLPGRRRKSE